LSKDSARASALSLSTPYKKTIDFQSSNSHQSVNSFLSNLNIIRKNGCYSYAIDFDNNLVKKFGT
jgi:hypothetical protein